MSVPTTNWQHKIYSSFRGVDYSTDATNIDDSRAADMLNLIADEAGFPSKRVGWRVLADLKEIDGNHYQVNGLHYMKFHAGAGVWLLHVGTKLYAIPHVVHMRNVLPDEEHLDVEYTAAFLPTQAHVDWLQGYIAGTITPAYEWQVANADLNGDGVIDEEDVKLLQRVVDTGITADLEGTLYEIVTSNLANAPSCSFEHDGNLYLLDGTDYYVIERKEAETEGGIHYYGRYDLHPVVGYVPTVGNHGYYYYDEKIEDDPGTWIHCSLYEEQNYLSDAVKNEMAGDAVHKDYWLTTRAEQITKVELLGADGETWTEETGYTSAEDGTRTRITFTAAPAQHPDGAGLDNIRITFKPKKQLDADKIKRCTIGTRYGYFNNNRVFVAGNPAEPNMDYMTGVDDPTYFPEFGWTKIGSKYSAIQGYLHYGSILAIVKEDTNIDPELYIRSFEVMEDQTVIFPVQQGVKGVGAASRLAFGSLRDDPLFYAREGVYAISGTDASQKNTVQNRSYFVDNKLRLESGKPVATVWKDRYLLCFPDTQHCYVADSRQTSGGNGGSGWVYEWYYWENIPAVRFYEIDGDLYFGTRDGRLCKFNNDLNDLSMYADGMRRDQDGSWTGGVAIPCFWKTKADILSSISDNKSLARRGCSVMLKPYEKSSVQAVVESSGLIVNQTVDVVGTEITTTVFPFERSIKHFSTLQMTFANTEIEEGFGLYGIQLRYALNRFTR